MPATLDQMGPRVPERARESRSTLCVDIGGTLVKAATVDEAGVLLSDFVTTPTPKPATPEAVIALIRQMTAPLPAFGRISVGFPGVVGRNHIKTAPNLGTEYWHEFDLAHALQGEFAVPVRVLNDAIVYGLGIAKGPGLECVLTFGTGMGCALFRDGTAFFGLELGQHYAFEDCNYDQYIGHAAFMALGADAWNKRAQRVIGAVQALTNSDRLYLGGGNSRRLTFELPAWASVVPPSAGVAGGVRLWHADLNLWFAASEDLTQPQTVRR
jgi:polyphosphate glucokinase